MCRLALLAIDKSQGSDILLHMRLGGVAGSWPQVLFFWGRTVRSLQRSLSLESSVSVAALCAGTLAAHPGEGSIGEWTMKPNSGGWQMASLFSFAM